MSIEIVASTTSGYAPLEVEFYVNIYGGHGPPYTYAWDFGDGGTASVYNPTHTFIEDGYFNVSLTVTDAGDTYYDSENITVSAFAIGDVSASPDSGTIPQLVTFSVGSVYGGEAPISYHWNYGDGTSGSSNTHTYTSAGSFSVSVTATDDAARTAGGGTSVYMSLPSGPMATISADSTYGFAPLEVNFSTSPTGAGPFTYAWDFGDGTGTSTLQNPTYTYASPGYYTAYLTVYDVYSQSGGDDQYITVETPPVYVEIDADPTTGSPPLEVDFTSEVYGAFGPFTYAWDFGDGTGTSTAENPTYTYLDDGIYEVSLLVTDSMSNMASDDLEIMVLYPEEPPEQFGLLGGGSAECVKIMAPPISGGLVAGGTADITADYASEITGGLLVGGETELGAEACGVLMGGTCEITSTTTVSVAGGLHTSGQAMVSSVLNAVPTGGLTLTKFPLPYVRQITVAAGKVGEDFDQFYLPIILELDPSKVVDSTFVFADLGLNPLAYEIREYDETTGRLAAYVRTPLKSAQDTSFYLLYGVS